MAKGYFIIADITGYTAFLTHSELEHAQDILNTLFNTLLEHYVPPLTVSNFQGDAILAYVPEGSFLQGQTLLEMLENLYYAFIDIREKMRYNTTCTCNACKNIPQLDLKFFMHYGSYMVQQMGPRQELMGPDVILTHRLMKNTVVETTGVRAYALITETAADAIPLDKLRDSMIPYTTTYEHLGVVKALVHDLHKVYEQRRSAQRVIVTPAEAQLMVEVDLPASPALVWDYLTLPQYKRQWLQLESVKRTVGPDGWLGEGTRFHCAHSAGDLKYSIVDWRPFDYFTTDGIEIFGSPFRTTYQLTPTAAGCRLSALGFVTDPEKAAQAVPIYQAAFDAAGGIIRRLIEADLASGKIVNTLAPTNKPAYELPGPSNIAR